MAYSAFAKARALGNLVVTPGSIRSMDFVGATPIITFTIIVQNTSGSSLLINSFAGNVYSGGTLVGNVYNFSPIAVPENSQIEVPVIVQLQMIGIVNDIIAAYQYGNTKREIVVEGFANVSSFQLPVTLKFTVGA